tara:strand:- start:33727 stop:34071 length:345 start_codon:yes stop_codon:yes gene_type:complete
MVAFRIYLILVVVVLGGYTFLVGVNEGWNLLPVFFGSIAELGWPGQFNLDFLTFLGLSATWVAWRHRFAAPGIALGVVAFFGGMMFLAPYLIWAIAKAKGDAKALLLGNHQFED